MSPTFDISTIMAGLVSVQSQLAISTPFPLRIKQVYVMPPNSKQALDMPCWVNSWDLIRIERKLTGGLLMAYYTITSDLFVNDADRQMGALTASAFMAPYMRAINTNITLNGSINQCDLRGGTPTLALLEWNGLGYSGLHTLLDIQTSEGVQFA